MGRAKTAETARSSTNPVRTACDSEYRAGEILRLAFEGLLENDICDLTMRQMAIYMNVSTKDGMTISDLAKNLNISMSSISRSVDALASKNVVRRQREGKYVKIFMTPRGKAVIGRAISSINHYL